MNKRSIDTQVAALLGISRRQVSLITTTFLRLAVRHIIRHGQLYMDGLGGFTRDGVKIRFKRSPRVQIELKETHMDKFAVDEGSDQETLEKAAAQGCPECGAKPERHGQTLVCPNHGTAPFEKKTS